MELAIIVYLASFISNLKIISFIAILIAIMALFVYSLFYSHQAEMHVQYPNRYEKPVFNKWYVYPLVIAVTIWIITPGERTMWLMAGGYAAQSAVQSEIGKDVLSIVELKVKKELKELTDEVVGKSN